MCQRRPYPRDFRLGFFAQISQRPVTGALFSLDEQNLWDKSNMNFLYEFPLLEKGRKFSEWMFLAPCMLQATQTLHRSTPVTPTLLWGWQGDVDQPKDRPPFSESN